MESWRLVFRTALVPLLSTESLVALEQALVSDAKELIQGATTNPPPMQVLGHWPVEAACPLAYCGWRGDGLETVAEVEEFFSKMSYAADQRLGEPGGIRHFLNPVDEWPRQEMIDNLLPEVRLALQERRRACETGAA